MERARTALFMLDLNGPMGGVLLGQYYVIRISSLAHSRLRMPQGSPGQGRRMPPGSISRGFDMFSRHP